VYREVLLIKQSQVACYDATSLRHKQPPCACNTPGYGYRARTAEAQDGLRGFMPEASNSAAGLPFTTLRSVPASMQPVSIDMSSSFPESWNVKSVVSQLPILWARRTLDVGSLTCQSGNPGFRAIRIVAIFPRRINLIQVHPGRRSGGARKPW
jgi:hypothetical protein